MRKHDPWKDPRAERWAKSVLADMYPKLKGSVASISLAPDGVGDVKYWVELGASIMLEKPLIVVALHDRKLPPKLRMIADEIVLLPDGVNPDGSDELRDAIKRVIERDEG